MSPSDDGTPLAAAPPRRAPDQAIIISRVTATVSLLAVGVWLGGLVALGAIAAPVVFRVVPLPTSADAMTVVFRRFDQVAMASGAILLASEGMRVVGRVAFARADQLRLGASLLACALAAFEGVFVSPRIAALHAGGAIRGVGDAGQELSRLHDLAEACGKGELLLLAVVVAGYVVALSRRA